jgi:hypothetical protein
MPTARSLFAGLALAFTAISCSQDKQSPTAPTDQPEIAGPNNAVATSATGLVFHNVTGTLTDGSTFRGTLRITSLAPNPNDPNTVLASGTLTGIVRNATGGVTRIVQTFTNIVLDITNPNPGTCRILDLDIGAIHLDLLGLVVDLAPVHLDIVAQAGPGNLLGNLLCAIAGLLDSGSPLGNLLNQLNALLGSLLGGL